MKKFFDKIKNFYVKNPIYVILISLCLILVIGGTTKAIENVRVGDILVNVNGEKVIVEQVQHEILDNAVKVYNFEVADNHNYYVAENSDCDTFILTHNKACDGYGKINSQHIIGNVKKYKNVRVEVEIKNANPIHFQWKEPNMNQHSYPWNNDKVLFKGLGKSHPINKSEAVNVARKLFERLFGGK